MQAGNLDPEAASSLEMVLGYLSFSSGADDPKFCGAVDRLYRHVAAAPSENRSAWEDLGKFLLDGIDTLRKPDSQLGDLKQAEQVVRILFENVFDNYLEFHRDILFHQQPQSIFNSFFIARAASAVVRAFSDNSNDEEIASRAIAILNDYIGFRPVAVLETEQKIEPYEHEWYRPVPLYISGAGIASGRYAAVVEKTLEILRQTDPQILHDAWFDLKCLDELCFDPKAYDFDHPANKRPNYHFGQWDPNLVDNRGFYRRFVIQQVTLDALMSRVDNRSESDDELSDAEALYEAAAVLAGTMLMASGTSGSGPTVHDSSTTLGTLLPHIAVYRDEFYQDLFSKTKGRHAERLREEATRLRQPLGAARQHLNSQLARRRAAQLQHVQLAQIFAQMGNAEAAASQADVVPVASARLMCRINCLLVDGRRALESLAGSANDVAAELSRITHQTEQCQQLVLRGIGCGALIDPWNILGFDAHFSLFPALENSVHDHRADQLIETISQVAEILVAVAGEAAAAGHDAIRERATGQLESIAIWWDKYATMEVQSVESFSGSEASETARHISMALAAWHQGGASSGDVAFWNQHVDQFNAPKTFAHVVRALLDKKDFVASMALLIQWLSRAEQISFGEGDDSFYQMTELWVFELMSSERADRAALSLKLLDYFEANADDFWVVPILNISDNNHLEEILGQEDPEEDDEEGSLYSAAYEDVVYRDSTFDGVDSELIEYGSDSSDYELELESRRIFVRLEFIATVARLAKRVVVHAASECDGADFTDSFHHLGQQILQHHEQLGELLNVVHRFPLASSSATQEAMLEYDRRRMIKDALTERIITTSLDARDAVCFLSALCPTDDDGANQLSLATLSDGKSGEDGSALSRCLPRLLLSLIKNLPSDVADLWPDFLKALEDQPVLYVPLSRGGNPRQILRIRAMQRLLHELVAWLPRLGLIVETDQLIRLIRSAETRHPVGHGAVTEFDSLYEMAFRSAVDCLVQSSTSWSKGLNETADSAAERDALMIEHMQQLTEPFLATWLEHSRTLRLSVLERVADAADWDPLVDFIQKYGEDFLTQFFLNIGNLRSILHQGVDNWLGEMIEADEPGIADELIANIGKDISRTDAVVMLTLTFESVVENFSEYRDYNSTTTQSDRGEMLYCFFDFLRLKTAYDRTNWNLKPVVIAHQMLVRRGQNGAAEIWRRALADRTSDIADNLLGRLSDLQESYAVKMPTISDRISEKFVRPLIIDRILALVQPAMREQREGQTSVAFSLLHQEAAAMTDEPLGIGLDIPEWLLDLEDEVQQVRRFPDEDTTLDTFVLPVDQVLLSEDQLQQQLIELMGDTE